MQYKFVIGLFLLINGAFAMPLYAQEDKSCYLEVAVSSPPVDLNQRVAFNISNYNGFSKSITLKGGSAPEVIDRLLCTDTPYTISATSYNMPSQNVNSSIGECTLKAGDVLLRFPYNGVAVVFPNDFIC